MQLTVKWHLWKALFAPSVWQLPTRRRGRLEEEEPLGAGAGAAVAAAGPEEAVAVEVVQNNYLLSHNPRLAELLADMPQFLAPENVQLLADVQVKERCCSEGLCAGKAGEGRRGCSARVAFLQGHHPTTNMPSGVGYG